MVTDSRSWPAAGFDDAVRSALNDGLASSELWSLGKLAFVASGFGSQLAAFACRRSALP